MIQENLDIFGEHPKYENLINVIVEIDTERKGDLAAADRLYNFGLNQLEKGRNIKAIHYLGRSLIKLFKEERRNELVRALYFISSAYESIGLLWAARGSLIHAAAINDFVQYQELDKIQYRCFRRLATIELQLGRVGYALEWFQADYAISQITRAVSR